MALRLRPALIACVAIARTYSQHQKLAGFDRKFFSTTRIRAAMSSQGIPTVDVASVEIEVLGKRVSVAGISAMPESVVSAAVESIPFQRWLKTITGPAGILSLSDERGTRCSLQGITIQSVDMFGKRVGFVKFKADIVDEKTGAKLPGVVFGRGGAVAVLMLLECAGEKHVVLTEQARVPVGRVILELPAGMLDDDAGDFVGTAAREIEEETGIHIKTSDLIDLTALLDKETGQKMFPSPGGSDEEITLLLYRGHINPEALSALQGQEQGLVEHGELIKVHVAPYRKLWRYTADAKALAAIAIYEMATKEGILPELSSL
ncbi:nudix hydrolase 14, chloroplastic isoform X2 [Selaginella moellendorffii]|uniref:nudix hydrolase 14, chloroplastic isoform X2 n=1 Tax=Selaginella moellendorffii TaxID=88036 RepID=UPI000D1C3EA8|nr:nudix hydrolase 14, chloroplastic isoform X2 [Selaginella moellendorffii]|eukprot:XP_024522533.1 nudix hydrolase 14, chloroplastic isoform X2 [Selaginella moellendorffii]